MIKSDVPTKDIEAPAPGKNVVRGTDMCTFCVSNYTGYFVKIYIDGYFVGFLEPNEDQCFTSASTRIVLTGYLSWYAETIGETYYWTDLLSCDAEYHYQLR